MSKPGVMIYFDTTPALMRLTLQECGQLFLSILTYAESGVISEYLDSPSVGMGIAWDLIKPSLDRDDKKYEDTCRKKRYATYCRDIDYRCVITYKDESTGLSLTHPLTISFSRVVNGSGIVDLLVTTPNGNVFKNEEVASLIAKAELWRGSTVDTTKVSYKWAVMDASVTATSSTGYDADFGIGWRKLSDTADKYTGTATNTLTVYAAAVDSYAVFKCCAQDTDSASASYNTKFFDVATFIDNSDPLQIIVTSTGGDVFKNGQGTTVLTAVCYQAGSEVDAAGNGSYTWTKYNKNGVVDTSWGTNGSKTGKTLSVSSADVDTKATFMVVVAL